MKVKDFINGQFQGRHNNLIFYTRGNNTYVRRYAIPGKKRKWETEGRTPKQQAVAIRFKAVQVFYMTFAKQVSPWQKQWDDTPRTCFSQETSIASGRKAKSPISGISCSRTALYLSPGI